MSVDEGLVEWVTEALEPFGAVTMRKMMGGATLYLDGAPFAIIGSDAGLWFKADVESDAEWDAAGAEKFSYTFGNGRVGVMNYRRAPEGVHDDADEMRRWAALAIAAGRRTAAAKKPRKAKARNPKPA